jgi:hypothetical protein
MEILMPCLVTLGGRRVLVVMCLSQVRISKHNLSYSLKTTELAKPRAKKASTTKSFKFLKSSTCFVSSRAAAGLPLAVPWLNHIHACHMVLIGATRDVGRAEQQNMLVDSLPILVFAI